MPSRIDARRSLQLRLFLPVTVLLAGILSAQSLRAEDTVFPPGTRVGLTPPAGLNVSSDFTGFMDPEAGTSIVIASMPTEAYAEVTAGMTAERFAAQGMTLLGSCENVTTTMESLCFRATQEISGYRYQKWLLIARFESETAMVVVNLPDIVMADGTYTAATIDAALSSLTYSETLASDPLDALPFTIEEGDLLPLQQTLGGSAALFGGPAAPDSAQPIWVVAASLDNRTAARELAFARLAFHQIDGVSATQVTAETPFAIDRLEGHIIEGAGKDTKTGSDLYVFQAILVDAAGKYYRLVGLVPATEKTVYRAEFLRLTQTLQPK